MKDFAVIVCQHTFSGRKKNPVQLVVITIFNPCGQGSGTLQSHQWRGSGRVCKEEMLTLINHWRKRKKFRAIGDYIDAEVAGWSGAASVD